jgi:HPt (histidine-containing phosphotransfer) domain-containing protein
MGRFMTLRETANDRLGDRRGRPDKPPIDVAHLKAQTMGNRDLEKEALRLFLRQSGECLEKIRAAVDIAARSEAAHALIGSARGVGAFSVAYIASEIELAKAPVTGRLIALDHAIEAARFVIADLLAE